MLAGVWDCFQLCSLCPHTKECLAGLLQLGQDGQELWEVPLLTQKHILHMGAGLVTSAGLQMLLPRPKEVLTTPCKVLPLHKTSTKAPCLY